MWLKGCGRESVGLVSDIYIRLLPIFHPLVMVVIPIRYKQFV